MSIVQENSNRFLLSKWEVGDSYKKKIRWNVSGYISNYNILFSNVSIHT